MMSVLFAAQAEQLPAPAAFVAIYALAWAVCVFVLAWLATRERGLASDHREVRAELQRRIDAAKQEGSRGPVATGDSED